MTKLRTRIRFIGPQTGPRERTFVPGCEGKSTRRWWQVMKTPCRATADDSHDLKARRRQKEW